MQTSRQDAPYFLEVLDQRWQNYNEQLTLCRAEFSEAAVHDLRVATRRLVAWVEMAGVLESHSSLKKLRRILKSQIDQLDDLRDTQVMLAQITEILPGLPALGPLHEHLQKRAGRLLRVANKQVKTFELEESVRLVGRIRLRLEKRLAQPESQTELLEALDHVYLTATQRYGRIDALKPATIHRLRLSFKKFRYMVEIVHPLLPDLPQGFLKQLHHYQSLMGEVQDSESFLNLLDGFCKKEPRYDAQPARRFYKQLRAQRVSDFLDKKAELLVFWRPSASQPYPWQTQSV